MEKSFDKNKFKRITRIIRIVLQSFYWACIVGGVICLLGFIALQFIPDQYLMVTGNSGFTLSMDGLIRYSINSNDITIGAIYKSITLMAALLSIGLIAFFKQLYTLLYTVEEDRPFAKENTARLKVMGMILLLYSALIPGAGVLVASTMIDIFDIKNIMVVYSVNITLLISGLVMLILAGVFHYGNYLQSEYDTTL